MSLLDLLYKKGYRKDDIERDVWTNVHARDGKLVARIDFDTEFHTGKVKGINDICIYDSKLERLLNKFKV